MKYKAFIPQALLIGALVLAAVTTLLTLQRTQPAAHTLANPIVARGQDPSIAYFRGAYYLVQSSASATRIIVMKAARLSDLGAAPRVTVFGPACCQIWAPELLPLDGRWYIYYAATSGTGAERDDAPHAMYVLESAGGDPLGPYTSRGRIAIPTDAWAIDGTVLTMGQARYFIWSGRPAADSPQQNLYIARMSNPWTLRGERSLLSSPTSPWERPPTGPPVQINEAPEALQHDGKLFLVYSARGSWTADYCLGMLTYQQGDVLQAASWTKSAGCVFAKNPAAGVYGPGHSTFMRSPDGTEDWIVYHATASSGAGWAGRSIRAQTVTWTADDAPNFGAPSATLDILAAPSGEPAD